MPPRPRLVKISGARGRWLAEVEGQWLPVLHDSHWNFHNHSYSAPLLPEDRDTKRCTEFLDALRAIDLAVMQRDATPIETGSLPRAGYIGVFRFSGLKITEDHLSLTLLERYASPRP